MVKVAWGALLAVFVLLQPTLSHAGEIPLIDAHSQLPSPDTAKDVVRLMDEAGIAHVILSFRGQGKANHVIGLAESNPSRITPAIKIKGKHWPTGSGKFYKSVKKQLNRGAFGAIGEALVYHAAKGDKAPEWTVLPEDKQFKFVLELAREKDLILPH